MVVEKFLKITKTGLITTCYINAMDNKININNKINIDDKNSKNNVINLKDDNNDKRIFEVKKVRGYLKNIKSPYIKKYLFEYIDREVLFKLIRYNNGLQKLFEFTLDHYKFFNSILVKQYYYRKNSSLINCDKVLSIYNYFNKRYENSKMYIGDLDLKKSIEEDHLTIAKIMNKVKSSPDKYCVQYRLRLYNNLTGLFSSRYNLRYVNLDFFYMNFKTIDLSFLFHYTSYLTEIEIKNINKETELNLRGFLHYCSDLEKIKFQNIETSKISDVSYMFYYCYKLKTISIQGINILNIIKDNIENNNKSKIENIFAHCNKKVSIDNKAFNLLKEINLDEEITDNEFLLNKLCGGDESLVDPYKNRLKKLIKCVSPGSFL